MSDPWPRLMKSGTLFAQEPEELAERRSGGAVPLLVSCGLGVNSTAALVLLARLGDRPDAVLFADTGGEKPETYVFRDTLSAWLRSAGFPEVTTVKRTTDHARQKNELKYDTLEEECLAKRCLPSIAYYGRSCSEKWKQQPQEKWANAFGSCRERWAAGGRCIKVIGYDADEPERAKVWRTEKWAYWHPLLDYDWGREECLEAIALAGLPAPPKSSCFFCPEMTPPEILALPSDLLARALALEDNAHLTGIKGLGKHEYSWRDLTSGKVPLPTVTAPRLPCMCYDGE